VAKVWRAAPEEAETVGDLLVEFRDWMERERPSSESLHEGVRQLIEDPQTEYLLGAAAAGDPPAGVCQLRFRYGLWHEATDCWLEDLYVSDEARGAGLGRALVDAAADRARARGCARVELDVSDANPPALALYEAAGFATGKDPGTHDLLMRLAL
jgi:ribosomal protein S18 acetylase RimI-like enzyme